MTNCDKKGCHFGRCCCFIITCLFLAVTAAAAFFGYGLLYCNNELNRPRTLQATVLFPIHQHQPEETTFEEEIDYRLPTALKPINYILKLQPLIYGNRSILGSVEVEIEVLEPTANITLHIASIITKNDTVKLISAEEAERPAIEIVNQTYDHLRQFYTAQLGQELEKGKRYLLSMEYEGYISDDLHGMYRSTYKDEMGQTRYLAVTQFEATDARRAFPCFDEPALKATFDIYVGREENMTSISNMPLRETLPLGQDGWYWDHFNTSVPMSTYLVAMAVSDFVYVNSSLDKNVEFRVWAREAAIDQADFALEKGPEVLIFYEEYFDIPFPLPKQDMIAVGDFGAGAMENWGLIVYRETAILLDPKIASASNKQRVMTVITHELAHQWFGNLVTPVWWTDIWLNEGFANFMENYGADHCEPTWKFREQVIVDDVQNVFALDCLESSHPIRVPVNNPDEIGQIFDDISYSKGTSVIRMMNSFLTETAFMKGIQAYLKAFQYKNAEQDDLWRYLTAAGHEEKTLPEDMTVKQVMDTWTLQMGYPVINVTRSNNGTSATVTQERFLLIKSDNSSDTHNYMWWVPLTYTHEDERDFEDGQPQIWMKDTEKEIRVDSLPANDKWVIFNIQQTGFYRVNYDENNWNLLVQQLQRDLDAIHLINRAQIIDDALDLARAGQLSYNTALSAISYLSNETEYVPWTAALDNLKYLKRMFVRTGGYGTLKKYLLDLLVPLYNSVGFDDDLNDPHLDQLKRVTAVTWVCDLGHDDCTTNSGDLYREWMKNPENHSIISPNQKESVFCTAIANGGENEWNFALHQYETSNVAIEKDALLTAMACSKELWILSRYLELTFKEDSPIRRQDAGRVFENIARNEYGRDLAWDYLREKWSTISTYTNSFTTLGGCIAAATEDFNTNIEKEEVEAFKEEHKKDLDVASRAVDQSLERISNNIEWMDNYYEVIVNWLGENS